MLHELLLALHGHSGDVFVEDSTAAVGPHSAPGLQQQAKFTSTTFRVAADFPFLHAAERSALDRLAHLGFLAGTIRRFAQRHAKAVWTAALAQQPEDDEDDDDDGQGETTSANVAGKQQKRLRPGVYLLALCTGLDEVLDEYETLLVQAETKLLSNLDLDTDAGRTPVSYFTYLFGKLVNLLDAIETHPDDNHGTKLLNILHDRCRTGLSEARAVFLRLFQICMAVFYKQLIGWMLHGRLNDQYEEFFISMQSSNLDARDPAREVQLQADDTRWQSQIKLKTAALPRFIPLAVAQNVLFIGKAVLTIKESRRPETARAAALVPRHQETLSKLAESLEYRALVLEMAVAALKRDVAAILWDVVVMDEHLVNHLKAFKECYMLGAGDLWMAFIEECGKLKTRATSRLSLITDYELNTTFRSLMRQLGMPNADFNAEHFRFKVMRGGPADSANGLESEEQSYQQLIGGEFRLEYVVKWPMDLVFTQSDIDKYNQILIFLLALKATHMRVQRVCSAISQSVRVARGTTTTRNQRTTPARQQRNRDSLPTAALPRELWQLRAMMMFFLDCLWSYIQMDVLEASQLKLLTQIMSNHRATSQNSDAEEEADESQPLTDNTHASPPRPPSSPPQQQQPRTAARPDFEEIQTAHHAHVDRILRGCFLDASTLRLVGGTIRKAVAACEAFCGVVDRLLAAGSWGSLEMEQDVEALKGQINGIRKDFEGHTSFLFRTFSGVQSSADGGAHARERYEEAVQPQQPAFYAAARSARQAGDAGDGGDGGGHDGQR
ncbi:Gamma-tubulin complex component 4 [Geranomyces variabilis]|nr:Gamma-tubulin complex component 4 [Geranomyces variabilis]